MIKELYNVNDIFNLKKEDIVTKRNLFDLIQYSKIKGNKYWNNEETIINNTPQQGINSIGKFPNLKGVILKTKKGVYDHDGWNQTTNEFKYAFKAVKGKVNHNDMANKALIEQPKYRYPIFLFLENKNTWIYEGLFNVANIFDDHVTLTELAKVEQERNTIISDIEDALFEEGEKKLVTHYKIERNRSVVELLKRSNSKVCEICKLDFEAKYGFEFIEAHHKIPHSSIEGPRSIQLSDFALLCPNCHRAVHLHMTKNKFEYMDIVEIIRKQLIV